MDDGTILIWIDGRWILTWTVTLLIWIDSRWFLDRTMGPFLYGLMVDGHVWMMGPFLYGLMVDGFWHGRWDHSYVD
jgi:hypothetical protein